MDKISMADHPKPVALQISVAATQPAVALVKPAPVGKKKSSLLSRFLQKFKVSCSDRDDEPIDS